MFALVVARDAHVSDPVREELEANGWWVTSVADRETALRSASDQEPTLVVVDAEVAGAVDLVNDFGRCHGGPGCLLMAGDDPLLADEADGVLSRPPGGGEVLALAARLRSEPQPAAVGLPSPGQVFSAEDLFGDLLLEMEGGQRVAELPAAVGSSAGEDGPGPVEAALPNAGAAGSSQPVERPEPSEPSGPPELPELPELPEELEAQPGRPPSGAIGLEEPTAELPSASGILLEPPPLEPSFGRPSEPPPGARDGEATLEEPDSGEALLALPGPAPIGSSSSLEIPDEPSFVPPREPWEDPPVAGRPGGAYAAPPLAEPPLEIRENPPGFDEPSVELGPPPISEPSTVESPAIDAAAEVELPATAQEAEFEPPTAGGLPEPENDLSAGRARFPAGLAEDLLPEPAEAPNSPSAPSPPSGDVSGGRTAREQGAGPAAVRPSSLPGGLRFWLGMAAGLLVFFATSFLLDHFFGSPEAPRVVAPPPIVRAAEGADLETIDLKEMVDEEMARREAELRQALLEEERRLQAELDELGNGD